jgi:hypothetical protein
MEAKSPMMPDLPHGDNLNEGTNQKIDVTKKLRQQQKNDGTTLKRRKEHRWIEIKTKGGMINDLIISMEK